MLYDLRLDTFFVLRHRDCAAVLRDPDIRTPDPAWLDVREPGWREHSAAVFLYNSLLRRNPPDHARLRRILRDALPVSPNLESVVDRALDTLAQRGAVGSVVDLQTVVATPVPLTVISDLLGVPQADRRWLASTVDNLVAVLDPLLAPAVRDRADQAADRLGSYFSELIEERSEHPRGDVASTLAAAARIGRLRTGEAHDALLLLFAAGNETTSGLIGNALHAVLRGEHRSADPAALIAETLRWDSPVQLTERVASRTCRIGEVTVPAGADITLVLGSANRDPQRFPAPDRFDPARTDRDALSFGAGPHYCLGAALAQQLAIVLLRRFLARFPKARLAGEATRRPSPTLRGFTSLPVVLDG
ncbi:cytochrome P450 [Phytohabitans aurantiacus]|uniref:cytochrome P450 n=1 Tax=Phytohabitans aurantiacus TaxID=3016789 RepID=UPI00248FC3ED|nr:cytochrome P450 [Phytohabitans aurantiacus]